MVCPDPDCQKIVESDFTIEKNRKDQAKRIKLLEDAARKRAIARAKAR